jgi:hypothetical protein
VIQGRFVILSVALIAAFNVGCASISLPGQTRSSAAVEALKGSAFPPAPATKEAFVAAAKAKGAKLTDAQLAEIQAERQVVPNGTWAPRPAEHLSAAENLDVHFRKHGHEFRPALQSEADYMAQGNAAATGKRGAVRYFFDTTSYQKGYQSHVVRWVPTTRDFTAFKADGSETTYYQNVPKPNRFIEVPVW